MAERRILETTQLLGALPADTLEALRQQSTTPHRRPERDPVPPGRPGVGAVRHRDRAHRHPDPLTRRPRVAGRGARRGLVVRRIGTVRRRPAFGRRAGARGDRPHRARVRGGTGRHRRPPDAAVGDRPAPRPPPAQPPTRRSPTRCSSTCPPAPRSASSSSPATQDEFRLPMTQEDLAGLVGASRERVNKALVAVHAAGLDRGRGPEPLPDPRPRRAPRARHALVASAGAHSGSRNESTRRQASAASSARCAGRSGSCTNPWSASGYTTISQSGRSAHAARSAAMSVAGVNGSTPPKIASVGQTVGRGVERLAGLRADASPRARGSSRRTRRRDRSAPMPPP